MIVLNRIFTPIPEVKDVVQISLDNKETWYDFHYSNVGDVETNRPAGYYYMSKKKLVGDGRAWIRVNNNKKVASAKMYNSYKNDWEEFFYYSYAEWQLDAFIEQDYTYYKLIAIDEMEYPISYLKFSMHLTVV